MTEVDEEVVKRVARWCAEAGRQAGRGEIRRALSPLTWDELLVVKALLADPPPARPLGPHALADIARGAPADLAAEREREGRYRKEPAGDEEATAADRGAALPIAPPPPRRRAGRKKKAGAGIVIRRARDRAADVPERAPSLPHIEELRRPEGRTVLEQLLRRHGGRRLALAAALAERWRRADGAVPGEEDLAALLDLHGLARAFEHRERDEILHALRAAGGSWGGAAARLGVEPAYLEAALARLGATAEADRIREERRRELRGRGTLSDRVRLLLADEVRLRDLGLAGEFEEDLRARLPEHVRALRMGTEPVAVALARSLSLTPAQATGLAARFGLDLDAARRSAPPARPRERPRSRPSRPAGSGRSAPGAATGRRPRPPRDPRRGGRRG